MTDSDPVPAIPFREAFTHHPEATVLMDMSTGLIMALNDQASSILDRPGKDMEGLPFSVLLPAEHRADTSTFSQQLRQTGKAEDLWDLQVGTTSTKLFRVAAERIDANAHCWILLTIREQAPEQETADASSPLREKLDQMAEKYAELNDPLQEIVSWIELQGDARLKRPAARLTEMLQSLYTPDGDSYDNFCDEPETIVRMPSNRRVPCAKNTALIVDDETNIRNLFNNMIRLSIPDITLDMASTGKEALKAFEVGHHSLIILDLKMPAMNGDRVLRSLFQICRLKAWKPPSVILCTGYDARELVNEMAEKQLPCTFLRKPVSRSELVEVVKRQWMSMPS